MDLVISGAEFTAGDMFELVAVVTNPGPVQYHNQPLAVVLEVLGTYFFHPDWTNLPNYESVTVSLGINSYIILSFIWPEHTGSADQLYFYSALVNPAMNLLMSNLASVSFSYY